VKPDEPLLAQEYEDQLDQHTKAQLLARVERLLRCDPDDVDTVAFKRNFRDSKQLYEQL
jgi:hypothetical protein